MTDVIIQCKVDECTKNVRTRGYCNMHYQRVLRTGQAGGIEHLRDNHGRSEEPEYQCWRDMRSRCEKPNHHDYHNYGGRGITVCNEWGSYTRFIADMGRRPEGLTLDRINNDGNYEPDNCRWTDYTVQNMNKRPSSRSKTGVSGVHWCKQKQKYQARLFTSYKTKHLGFFNTVEEAAQARQQAEAQYFQQVK